MNLSPKRIYEKIVLTGYAPNALELKILEGTHWYDKLQGNNTHNYSKFKGLYRENVMPSKSMDRYELAEYVMDVIEEEYDLHFSNPNHSSYGTNKLEEIKNYAFKVLNDCKGNKKDKLIIAERISYSQNIAEMLIRLNMLSINPLDN